MSSIHLEPWLVALDVDGNIAAGTSTGGLEGSPAGRVGDSPQPGCGFYAENHSGAVAFSGDGEHIARVALAARSMQAIRDSGPEQAIASALSQLDKVDGEAGGIGIDAQGRIGWAHNSRDMAVAMISSEMREPLVYLRKAEEASNDA